MPAVTLRAVKRIAWLMVLASLYEASALAANCYVLKNNTQYPQTFHFHYNVPIDAGQVTQINLTPHSQYPVNGQWCWDDSTKGMTATVSIDNGAYVISWKGTLVMGAGGFVNPSGTYSLNPPPPHH
jgi:hypothetical protein